MKKRSYIAFVVLAIVFATLALREVVLLGFEFGRWARLLTIGFASAAAGAFVAAAVRARRAARNQTEE
ncbi:hypothetical protein KKH27_03945 [bacterium]|nr:hypothetical protein [bacterium]MBU1984934.1 hypothetical protein [bacterium]